jgi:hypothetical protein
MAAAVEGLLAMKANAIYVIVLALASSLLPGCLQEEKPPPPGSCILVCPSGEKLHVDGKEARVLAVGGNPTTVLSNERWVAWEDDFEVAWFQGDRQIPAWGFHLHALNRSSLELHTLSSSQRQVFMWAHLEDDAVFYNVAEVQSGASHPTLSGFSIWKWNLQTQTKQQVAVGLEGDSFAESVDEGWLYLRHAPAGQLFTPHGVKNETMHVVHLASGQIWQAEVPVAWIDDPRIGPWHSNIAYIYNGSLYFERHPSSRPGISELMVMNLASRNQTLLARTSWEVEYFSVGDSGVLAADWETVRWLQDGRPEQTVFRGPLAGCAMDATLEVVACAVEVSTGRSSLAWFTLSRKDSSSLLESRLLSYPILEGTKLLAVERVEGERPMARIREIDLRVAQDVSAAA